MLSCEEFSSHEKTLCSDEDTGIKFPVEELLVTVGDHNVKIDEPGQITYKVKKSTVYPGVCGGGGVGWVCVCVGEKQSFQLIGGTSITT